MQPFFLALLMSCLVLKSRAAPLFLPAKLLPFESTRRSCFFNQFKIQSVCKWCAYQPMEFENRLRWQCRLAILAGAVHTAAIWVGGGAMTWATVVLMGGFASALPIPVFTNVTKLVLLLVTLLALEHFTCKLVTKKSLSTGSLQPLKLVYRDKRLYWVTFIKFVSCVVQCVLVIIFIFARPLPDFRSLIRQIFSFSKPQEEISAADLAQIDACLRSCLNTTGINALQTNAKLFLAAQNSTDMATTNLEVCLLTFHTLVFVTGILVSLCNVYIIFRIVQVLWFSWSGRPNSLSLTRYHDEVLSRSLNNGLVDGDEFDAMEFLMRGVGEDLVLRKIAPLEVKRQNEDFIKYSLYHANGVEMVMEMLASNDPLRQQTAANMLGFWSSESNFMKRPGMELLLSRLGEKLGFPGKVAEGAANSFKSLALAWCDEDASPLLKVYVSRFEGQQQHFGAAESISIPEGDGQRDISAGESVSSSGGKPGGSGEASSVDPALRTRGSSKNAGPKWNVVQKVVDLVANKRTSTLLVYVRVLDAFFMSKSIRESLTKEEKDQISWKLEMLARGSNVRPGDVNQRSDARPRDAEVRIESSTRARTKMLAFCALERLLGVDCPPDERLKKLLEKVNEHLQGVQEPSVIWFQEVEWYEKLCDKYSVVRVDFQNREKWKINSLPGKKN